MSKQCHFTAEFKRSVGEELLSETSGPDLSALPDILRFFYINEAIEEFRFKLIGIEV